MTDHKFTGDEIIKALELCSKLDRSFEECDKCPYKGECGTKDGNMPADALDLINRRKAEIEKLKDSRDRWKQIATDFDKASRETEKEIERLTTLAELGNMKANDYREMRNKLKKANAEIESLKKIGDDKTSEVLRHDASIRELHKQLETARSEAIKEFAERLKPRVDCEYGNKFYRDKCFDEIEALVKEMTEKEV